MPVRRSAKAIVSGVRASFSRALPLLHLPDDEVDGVGRRPEGLVDHEEQVEGGARGRPAVRIREPDGEDVDIAGVPQAADVPSA